MLLPPPKCIAAADPFPPMHDSSGKTAVNGKTLRWSVTCTMPKITAHQDWTVHYHVETMAGHASQYDARPLAD
jgi:hypothetical protein